MYRFLFFVWIWTMTSPSAYADLKPQVLKITLSAPRQQYQADEVIQLTLTFTNVADRMHTLILPYTENKGKKLIYLTYYTVKDNSYTEVARESREVQMDTGRLGASTIKNLNPGESVSVPIFLNDSANYTHHIEAHHRLPGLPPGDYWVLAWYHPWDDPLGQYVFNKISLWGDTEGEELPERINLSEGGETSNYLPLTITPQAASITQEVCKPDCAYCRAIEKGRWKKVARMTGRHGLRDSRAAADSATPQFQTHCNVTWVYHGPDAILASLPSYTSQRLIFRNSEGYHYFVTTWQIGLIYPSARYVGWVESFLPIDLPIRTENLDYLGLIRFERY